MVKAISIKNLKKTYDNGFEAVKGIDLEVEKGDFFALLGPNGAGKSTTIGIICSLVNKTSGQVSVFGHDLDSNPNAVKSHIGIVPQEFNFNIFHQVKEIVVNQGGFYGIDRKIASKRADELLKQLGLYEKRDQMAMQLSGGQKRRLMIARALIHNPKLLILDEPTAGVDIELRRSMWDFIIELNKKGTTIILTTHYLEEAENLCKNIAIIDHGIIIENTSVKKLLNRLDTQTLILDIEPKLKTVPELKGFQITLEDPTTLHVTISKETNINELVTALTKNNIKIVNLRNKNNRLEELFIQLVKKQ